jgi:hypothetical protein
MDNGIMYEWRIWYAVGNVLEFWEWAWSMDDRLVLADALAVGLSTFTMSPLFAFNARSLLMQLKHSDEILIDSLPYRNISTSLQVP